MPAIVLINYKGYQHFVVVKGMRDAMVLVGDPSLGSKLIPREEFESMWSNRILFVIRSHRDKTAFNSSADWRGKVRASLGGGPGPRQSRKHNLSKVNIAGRVRLSESFWE